MKNIYRNGATPLSPLRLPINGPARSVSAGDSVFLKGENVIMKRILFAAIAMLAFAFYSTASQAAITSFTVDSATLSKSTGAITVTGTIVCTAGDVFFASAEILQVSGRQSGLTSGSAAFGTCSGGVDTWVASQAL